MYSSNFSSAVRSCIFKCKLCNTLWCPLGDQLYTLHYSINNLYRNAAYTSLQCLYACHKYDIYIPEQITLHVLTMLQEVKWNQCFWLGLSLIPQSRIHFPLQLSNFPVFQVADHPELMIVISKWHNQYNPLWHSFCRQFMCETCIRPSSASCVYEHTLQICTLYDWLLPLTMYLPMPNVWKHWHSLVKHCMTYILRLRASHVTQSVTSRN